LEKAPEDAHQHEVDAGEVELRDILALD